MKKSELDELQRLLKVLGVRVAGLWLHYRLPDDWEHVDPEVTGSDYHQSFDRVRVLTVVQAQAGNLHQTLEEHGKFLLEES